MANLRFSPGFMKQISSFGSDLFAQDPSDPRMGGGGMAGMLTRSVGGLAGRDMRTGQEKLQQGLSAIDPNDPQKMAKMYGLLAQFGTPEQRIAATGKMQELAQKQQQQTQLTALRSSLKDRATALKLPDSYTQTIDNAGTEQLGKLAEDLRELEFEDVSRTERQPALDALATAYGLKAVDVVGLDYEEIEKMGKLGEGTESKRFEKQDGSIVQLPVRGGKVFSDGKWQTPVAAGVVEEDPNVSTVINRTEEMGSKIGDTIASSFDNSYNEIIDVKEQAIANRRAFQLVDEGILAGRFSGVLQEADMIFSAFTGEPTMQKTQNTIELARQRAAVVLDNISALGAGSGVSNNDLKFMERMAASDLSTVTKEDVIRLLGLERDVIERSRENFIDDLDFLKEKDYIDQTEYDYFLNKVDIIGRYEFDEDDIDMSGFQPDTVQFLNNFLRRD